MAWSQWAKLFVLAAALVASGCKDDFLKSLTEGDENGEGGIQPPPGETPDPTDVTTQPPVSQTCPPLCPPPPSTKLTRVKTANPIPAENAQDGDWSWRNGKSANHGEVELYATTESAAHGESVGVKVSTSTPGSVTAELFRIGHYKGAGARKVWSGGPWEVSKQKPCPRDAATSLVECHWEDTFSFTVDPSWVGGLYVIKVMRDGYKRFYPFVVRDDRAAEILYTPNFTTYQAYNTWGGESLYYDASGTMPNGRAYQVSFNRPYEATDGGGKTFNLDVDFIQFMEQYGYDVTYGSQLDFLRYENFLEGISAFVGSGQDEYTPVEERDQLEAALASGKTSLAYFGGNGFYWRVRFLSDTQGRPLRTMACYKNEQHKDPIPNSTSRYRDEPDARPEGNLLGVMYEGWQMVPFPMVVSDPQHWIFQGTGLTYGTQLHGLIGYEYDRAFTEWQGYPSGVKTSMTSPVVSAEGLPSYSNAVDRTLPSGTLVFSAGTIWYPLALSDDPELHDERVEKMTLNVLERALQHRRPVKNHPKPATGIPAAPAPIPVWAKSVAHFTGQVGQGGYVDGPSSVAKFKSPTGLAVTVLGELVVADTGNNRVRMVVTHDPTRAVITIGGNGDLGYRDGEASQAMFRMPTDVAVGPAGEIYVADSDNHVIRRIDKLPAGGWTVSTVAGKGFEPGYVDGALADARFNRPLSIEVDGLGNLYVADSANNRVRMINAATGQVTTIAGSGGWGGDDAAVGTQATFNMPTSLTLGNNGELFVMDAGNQLVRRIAPGGTRAVDTVAGNRNAWFGFADGAGNVARFRAQMGLAVIPEGDVIVADTANYRIRKLVVGANDVSTQVFTIAGSGLFGTRAGSSGDVSDIVAPTGLAVGTNQKIYVSDSFHHVIREITR